MAMFPDAGPSRPPGHLPFKPSPGDRAEWRRDGYEPRERGFSRDGRDVRDGRDPRDLRDGPPGRAPYPYRRDAPGFRPGYPRSRTPSPPRRFEPRDRPYERQGEDQWRPPPRSLPPSRDGRDRDYDRDYRRDRFRDDPRSNPPSVGPSPPERARSPPFRNSRPFPAQTPPNFTPRVTSGPRGTATPAPREIPRARDDRFAGRDINRMLDTPTAGPSTNPAPRAPRSMRGSSSPVDTLRSKTDQSPATAPTRTVPLPSDVKSEHDADLEEGEVVSPVKPLAPLAPWVKREEDRERARRGTWEYDRGRERPFDRERDRDWERRPSYRFGGGSTSPQKRRSRSPLATSRREDPSQQRARSNSNPMDRNRRDASETSRQVSESRTDDVPKEPVVRPATPEDPPQLAKYPDRDSRGLDNVPPTSQEVQDTARAEKPSSLSLHVNVVEPIGRPDTPASPRFPNIVPPGRPDTPSSPRLTAQAPMAIASKVTIEAAPEGKSGYVDDTPPVNPASSRETTPSPPGQVLQTPPRPDTPATPLPPLDDTDVRVAPNGETLQRTVWDGETAKEVVPETEAMNENAFVSVAVTDGEDVVMASPTAAPFEETKAHETGQLRSSPTADNVDVVVSPQPAKLEVPQETARPSLDHEIANEPRSTSPAAIAHGPEQTSADPLVVSKSPRSTLPVDKTPRVTIAERRGLVSLPAPAGPLSSPFGDGFARRDPQLTSASDAETDYGPKTGQTEVPPTPHIWVDEDEDERLSNLVGTVKGEQGRKVVFDEHQVLSVNKALSPLETSRVNSALTNDKERNKWIEELTWPMTHTRVAHLVTAVVKREADVEKDKAERLKDEYQQWHADWVHHCGNLQSSMKKRGNPPADLYAVPNSVLIFPPAPIGPAPTTPVEDMMMSGTRRRRNMGDAVATEADFEAILADLADDAAKDPNLRASKTSAVVPDMLPYEERKLAYDDDNDLVTDPLSYYDYNGVAEPTWTEEERVLFLRRYLSHPKQFGKIAEVLPNKTAAECVAYYYRTKKEVDYKGMLASRRGDKKKKLPIKNAGKGSALLSNLGQQKPTVSLTSTPGPRSAITPARKDETTKSRQRTKDSGASTPIHGPRKRIEGEEDALDSGPSRAGSETPSSIKHKMRVSMKGPKRPRMSSVTDLAALATVPVESPTPATEMPEELADQPETAPTVNANGTIPADLLPPVKRAGKRRKVDPNDPNAIIEEKDPNKPSSRRPTTNSYWSVEEKKKFRELVVQHGTDARLIAAELGGKSERQVSNFYEAHKADMRLDELAKGGDEALAELNRMNGPPEPRPESRDAKLAGFGPNQPASFARSIYDVYPSSVRRSDAFEQRFAEPRLGMFPPSPPHGQSNLPGELAPPRSGGMRISALLNDEPTGEARVRQPSPVRQSSSKYDTDAASDGTVSERDGEGGVTRPSPRSMPQVPGQYPRQSPGFDLNRRPSVSYDRPEPFRSATAQPYEQSSAYYPHPPPRAATAAPSLPPQSRATWESPRPPYADYQREPYYPHPRPLPPPPPHHPPHSTHPPHPSQSAPRPRALPQHSQPRPQIPQHSQSAHPHPQSQHPSHPQHGQHPPRREDWRGPHGGMPSDLQPTLGTASERRYDAPSQPQMNGSGR